MWISLFWCFHKILIEMENYNKPRWLTDLGIAKDWIVPFCWIKLWVNDKLKMSEMSFISPKAYILFNCIVRYIVPKNERTKKTRKTMTHLNINATYISWANIIVEAAFFQGISFYRLWYFKDIFYGYESVDHSNITAIVSLYYGKLCCENRKTAKANPE